MLTEEEFRISKNLLARDSYDIRLERHPDGVLYRLYKDDKLHELGFITKGTLYSLPIYKNRD